MNFNDISIKQAIVKAAILVESHKTAENQLRNLSNQQMKNLANLFANKNTDINCVTAFEKSSKQSPSIWKRFTNTVSEIFGFRPTRERIHLLALNAIHGNAYAAFSNEIKGLGLWKRFVIWISGNSPKTSDFVQAFETADPKVIEKINKQLAKAGIKKELATETAEHIKQYEASVKEKHIVFRTKNA